MPQSVHSNVQHVARASSADRVRVSRARRQRHERVVPLEVRDSEVAALVAHGFLMDDRKDDPRAIADALGRLLDQIPVTCWPTVQLAALEALIEQDRCASCTRPFTK